MSDTFEGVFHSITNYCLKIIGKKFLKTVPYTHKDCIPFTCTCCRARAPRTGRSPSSRSSSRGHPGRSASHSRRGPGRRGPLSSAWRTSRGQRGRRVHLQWCKPFLPLSVYKKIEKIIQNPKKNRKKSWREIISKSFSQGGLLWYWFFHVSFQSFINQSFRLCNKLRIKGVYILNKLE